MRGKIICVTAATQYLWRDAASGARFASLSLRFVLKLTYEKITRYNSSCNVGNCTLSIFVLVEHSSMKERDNVLTLRAQCALGRLSIRSGAASRTCYT